MNRPVALLPLIAVLAAGCGVSLNYVPLNKPPRPMSARPPESVHVYTASRPERPHLEVGMIEAQQESAYSHAPPAQIVAQMRSAAGQLGCDGLVLTGGNDAVVGGGSVTNGIGSAWARTLKGYRGTCIIYRIDAHENARAPAPAASLVQASDRATCEPPCSPGYRCQDGECVALCNPACASGLVCGSDRVCRRP